jgi:hypothetical protein
VIKTILLAVLSCAALAHAAPAGKFEDLGHQITSTTLQGTTFARTPDGRDVVATVVRGDPARLLVFDVKSGKLLHDLTMENTHGAWNATTASDGAVYIGTDAEGHLFRWTPGSDKVEDLGLAAKGDNFIWDVTPGVDGEVFCGTYPGCRVVRYHPKDGFTDVSKGNCVKGENYVRALSYDPASKHVFAGIGAHAHLIELDTTTAQKTDILPQPYLGKRKFTYGVDVVAGKLFAMLVGEAAETIVIDLATREQEATLPVGLQVISPKSPYGDVVYFNSGRGIAAYDLKTHAHEKVDALQHVGVVGMSWIKFDEPDFPGETLVGLTPRGRIVRYHPKTGKSDSRDLVVPPNITPIQSMVAGPDGKIYIGGYLVGGLTRFDPATDKHEQIGNAGQPEGMAPYGDRFIYLGIYPDAKLKVFDVTKPCGDDNPRQFESLVSADQDRPFAVLPVESMKKVFFGTIPDYGSLGGALSVYDIETDKTQLHRNVVQDQGVSSLAYANGLIVGGTTIRGGLGILPKEKEAKLFLWDPQTKEKVFETNPSPGATLVSGLIVGPDKNIWGIASGDLFVFDIAARKVLSTTRVTPTRGGGWHDAHMEVNPTDGNVYVTTGGRLLRIDPKTMQVTTLREKGAGLLVLDRAGRIYFRDRTNLWRYTP